MEKQFISTDEAIRILEDLNKFSLQVILIDAPQKKFEGHKIRIAVNRNSEFWKDFYYSYGKCNKKKVYKFLEKIIYNEKFNKESKIFKLLLRLSNKYYN
jgi:hypothetical protein